MRIIQGYRQAITTRYMPPTNHRGARVKATACAGSITVPFSYGEDPHDFAAQALCDKFGWDGTLVSGGAPDSRGNVYVFMVEVSS